MGFEVGDILVGKKGNGYCTTKEGVKVIVLKNFFEKGMTCEPIRVRVLYGENKGFTGIVDSDGFTKVAIGIMK